MVVYWASNLQNYKIPHILGGSLDLFKIETENLRIDFLS